MKPNQTLDEVNKYLQYVAGALYSVSNTFDMDRNDKSILKKYADDLLGYAKNIEYLKNNISWKKEMEKKMIEEEQLKRK